jgi:hypothetical protein
MTGGVLLRSDGDRFALSRFVGRTLAQRGLTIASGRGEMPIASVKVEVF